MILKTNVETLLFNKKKFLNKFYIYFFLSKAHDSHVLFDYKKVYKNMSNFWIGAEILFYVLRVCSILHN